MYTKPDNRIKVALIGCGNVAWHICAHLCRQKKIRLHVYNHRHSPSLESLRHEFNCQVFPDLGHIETDADYYILAVSDSKISETARKIKPHKVNALLVHTSGSVDLDSLGERVHATAVLYPLQSFTRLNHTNWNEVPVILEADNKTSLNAAKTLAALFSKHIFSASHKERLHLHLAAVLVNNFTNALFAAAYDVLGNKKKNFTLLMPLIANTVSKLDTMIPAQAQTGPAKRNDRNVMKKHLKMLKDDKDLSKIYVMMSELIKTQQTKHAKL